VEFILVIVAAMLAGLIGWMLKQSFNTQPWVAEAVSETANQAPLGANAKVVGLTTLLAVITSFFALIVSAYALRMDFGDWIPLAEPRLLWVNTVLLIAASIAFQWTRNAAVRGVAARLRPGLLLTGVLTIALPVRSRGRSREPSPGHNEEGVCSSVLRLFRLTRETLV